MDWGEIKLLTPSVFVRYDLYSPAQRSNIGISSSSVYWTGKNSGNHHQSVTVDFIIENDGGPVDIELARGADGDQRGVANGSCEVVIYYKRYINRGTKTGWRNSQYFYQCEVNPAAWTIGL